MACSAIDKICSFVLNWLIKNKTRTSESADIADEMLETDEIEDPVRVARNRLLSTGSINGAAAAAAASAATGARGSVDLTGGATSLLSKQQQQQQDGAYWLVEYVLRNKDVMTYLLVVLFNVVVFENRNNHWALSRPLLGLILLNRDFFTEYTNTFVQAQLPDRQEPLQKLVSGVSDLFALLPRRHIELYRATCGDIFFSDHYIIN
jgi:exportin-7